MKIIFEDGKSMLVAPSMVECSEKGLKLIFMEDSSIAADFDPDLTENYILGMCLDKQDRMNVVLSSKATYILESERVVPIVNYN